MQRARRAPPDLPEVERAYQAGLRLLAYRPRAVAEMRVRLARRFSPASVQEAVVRLQAQGYLDDAAFARFWRGSREAHRPRSASLIQHELQRLGVSKEMAQAATASLNDDANAYQAGLHRLRALQGLDAATFRRRLGDYLRRRGFSIGTALHIAERLWRERAL